MQAYMADNNPPFIYLYGFHLLRSHQQRRAGLCAQLGGTVIYLKDVWLGE
ncbi:MAG: hypothetical protein R2838_16720 [Caldilineaceae bacterium]